MKTCYFCGCVVITPSLIFSDWNGTTTVKIEIKEPRYKETAQISTEFAHPQCLETARKLFERIVK